jgi:predicted nicotinamide N-methyase
VRSEYADDVGTTSVLLGDVVANHDFDAPVVRRAFDRLAEAGVGRRLQVDDLGTALDFG